jgi:diguanylate cyclase (GGDEF)-like protein
MTTSAGTPTPPPPEAIWAGGVTADSLRDPATGLATRALFLDRVKLSIQRRRRKRVLFAVLYLVVDRMREIRAEAGPEGAAELHTAIARRLLRCIRDSDTAAHPGGDGYALLLDDLAEVSDAARVAHRIQTDLEAPLFVAGRELRTTVRIGIAMTDDQYVRPQDVVRDAHTAAVAASAPGRVHYRMFDPSMHAVDTPREMEGELAAALENGGLVLHYEPIVALGRGHVTGFQALLRWNHPRRGLLAGEEFLPVAEDAGLMGSLGRWALTEACRQARAWQQQLASGRAPSVHLKLSAEHFRAEDLPRQVEAALSIHRLAPHLLTLEVPENVVMERGKPALEMMQALKQQGTRLIIDDFGMGYFSLGHLHRFPIDGFKIDRSFVGGLGVYDENHGIVRTIVSLAASLGVASLAEGVESPQQLVDLRAAGCGYAQGRHFSAPLDPAGAMEMMAGGAASL